MALMAGTTREESVVVNGAAVAAAPDPEVPGCPESAKSEGPGNRCSKLLTPWIAAITSSRTHQLRLRQLVSPRKGSMICRRAASQSGLGRRHRMPT